MEALEIIYLKPNPCPLLPYTHYLALTNLLTLVFSLLFYPQLKCYSPLQKELECLPLHLQCW